MNVICKSLFKSFLIFSLLFYVACKNNSGNSSKAASPANTDSSKPPLASGPYNSEAFYKRLEGSVAGKRVVLHFTKFKDSFLANYYYTDIGQPINLYPSLQTVENTDSLVFVEYSGPTNYEEGKEHRWYLVLTENGARGRWVNGETKTSHEVFLKENYPDGAHLFNVVGFKDSVLVPLKNDTLMARSEEMMLEPADAALAGNWFKKGVLKAIWEDSSGAGSLTLSQLLERDNKAFLEDYKSDMKDMRKNNELNDTGRYYSLNYENMMNANLIYNDQNFVVMEVSSHTYLGGAHGMHGSMMVCYDVKDKDVLSLDDILTIDSVRLQQIVEKNFKLRNKLKPNQPLSEILFENKLPANDNFYFTHKGLGFIYQPYEVAAYAFGIVDVFIPFADLKQYLKPEFSQRMGLF